MTQQEPTTPGERPDPATLERWWRQWDAIAKAAYVELVASYTPEQRAIIARMNEAKRQARLCNDRIRYPEGRQRVHVKLCAWPTEPPR